MTFEAVYSCKIIAYLQIILLAEHEHEGTVSPIVQ
jgi:hypothetical protein